MAKTRVKLLTMERNTTLKREDVRKAILEVIAENKAKLNKKDNKAKAS